MNVSPNLIANLILVIYYYNLTQEKLKKNENASKEWEIFSISFASLIDKFNQDSELNKLYTNIIQTL